MSTYCMHNIIYDYNTLFIYIINVKRIFFNYNKDTIKNIMQVHYKNILY